MPKRLYRQKQLYQYQQILSVGVITPITAVGLSPKEMNCLHYCDRFTNRWSTVSNKTRSPVIWLFIWPEYMNCLKTYCDRHYLYGQQIFVHRYRLNPTANCDKNRPPVIWLFICPEYMNCVKTYCDRHYLYGRQKFVHRYRLNRIAKAHSVPHFYSLHYPSISFTHLKRVPSPFHCFACGLCLPLSQQPTSVVQPIILL